MSIDVDMKDKISFPQEAGTDTVLKMYGRFLDSTFIYMDFLVFKAVPVFDWIPPLNLPSE